MKQLKILTILLYVISINIATAQVNDNTVFYIPRSKGKVKVLSQTALEITGALPRVPITTYGFEQIFDPQAPEQENQLKSGISVNVGRNFGANNLADGTPMDNTMAISNGGFIISADNRQVDIYNENGDTLKQFTYDYPIFYDLSSFTIGSVFDPRVIYDRYADRFILVTMGYLNHYDSSCIYVSFSKNNTPTDSASWNHYKLPIDSTHLDITKTFWYDYINIAINKDELFITTNVFEYVAGAGHYFEGNALYQIKKQDGYDSLTLTCKKFSNITNSLGDLAFTLVPLSESLQSDSYNEGVLMVSNDDSGGDKLYWYHLSGNIIDITATISKHDIITTPYDPVPYSSQPGGNGGDRIKKKRRL